METWTEGRKKRVTLQVRQIILYISRAETQNCRIPWNNLSGEILWIDNRDIHIYKNNEGHRRHLFCTHSYPAPCVCAVGHAKDATVSNTQERGKGLCEWQFWNYCALIQTIIITNPNYWQQKYSKAALNFQQQNSQLLLGEMGSWSRSPKIHLQQPSDCWGNWKQTALCFAEHNIFLIAGRKGQIVPLCCLLLLADSYYEKQNSPLHVRRWWFHRVEHTVDWLCRDWTSHSLLESCSGVCATTNL